MTIGDKLFALRYRSMFDETAEAAKAGNYCPHDQAALERKAQTIVSCFIDSELAPKVQVLRCCTEAVVTLSDGTLVQQEESILNSLAGKYPECSREVHFSKNH